MSQSDFPVLNDPHCPCPAQMQPHDKVPGVCPIPRVGVEWRERKGLWRDPSGGRHSTRVREGVE